MMFFSSFLIFDAFADEEENITKELATRHKDQAQIYENEARNLARMGKYQEASDKFTLAAEQYHEASTYYLKLKDYFNAAEYNGRASLAHEEAAIIHSEINDLSTAALHYFFSDKYLAHSRENKGIALFGDAYLLPPRYQVHLVDDPHEIVCREDLELVFKIDDSPACVSDSSKIKLIDRGWAKS